MQHRPSHDSTTSTCATSSGATSTGYTTTGGRARLVRPHGGAGGKLSPASAQDPSRRSARLEELLQAPPKPLAAPNWAVPNEIEYLLLPMLVGPDLDLALDSALLSAGQLLCHHLPI